MIKLDRALKPSYLTDAKVVELTNEFKSSGKSVWNNHNIKTPLLNSSHGKCAYCECNLQKESNYMEVEHFEDKLHTPEKVVFWENLLPSCKKCNSAKGTHNVILEPIVNPYCEDPKEHFKLRFFRLRGKTNKGKNTIDVTDLNNSNRLVMSRFEIGEKISELLETALDRFESYQGNSNVRSRNKLIGVIEGILDECQPASSYAAFTSTILLTDEKFLWIVAEMKKINLWTNDLDILYLSAEELALECA
jgi:uncharacterized protein (TIGR02646 family)